MAPANASEATKEISEEQVPAPLKHTIIARSHANSCTRATAEFTNITASERARANTHTNVPQEITSTAPSAQSRHGSVTTTTAVQYPDQEEHTECHGGLLKRSETHSLASGNHKTPSSPSPHQIPPPFDQSLLLEHTPTSSCSHNRSVSLLSGVKLASQSPKGIGGTGSCIVCMS